MSRRNRREFFDELFFSVAMGSLAASGAFAAPEPVAAPRRRVGPNDRVRVGVIGVRGRGMSHVNGYLAQPDCDVVAVCDVDLGVTGRAIEAVEKKSGRKPEVFQDLRRLIERNDIDAVSLALPIHWHSLASIWAMQAGKDVYCEKPVSHNVSEGRRSVEAARRYGRICQTGTQSRSSRAVRDAIAFAHSGKIGRVTLSRGLCYKRRDSIGKMSDAPTPENVAYDVWLGPAPKRAFNPNRFHYNWHWMWDYGTGDLGNQGIHQMDIARWALGKKELPRGVVAVGGRFGYVDQGETPNTVAAIYDYGDAHLVFEVRGLKTDGLAPVAGMPGVQIGDIVYGEGGYVVFSSNYGQAAAFDKSGRPLSTFSGDGDHFGNFVRAIKSRKPGDLNAPIEEGHLSSALCHLGNVSYKLGRSGSLGEALGELAEVPHAGEALERMIRHLSENGVAVRREACQIGRRLALDPRRERFVGAPDADALLTRPYRAPFIVPERM